MTDFDRRPLEGILALNPLCLDEDGGIDYEGIRSNVGWLGERGIHGVVQFASMGQVYAPSEAEFDRVTDLVVEAADDAGLTCVVGATAPNQQEAIRRTTYAESAGADGVMLAAPYAFPVQEDWAVDFFRDVDGAVDEAAVMVYNYPHMTDVNITADAWRDHLLDLENVGAVKESNFSALHRNEVLLAVRDRVNFISAGDSLFWGDSMLGAEGFIGILTWVAPGVFLEYYRRCTAGDHFDEWTRRAYRRMTDAIGTLTSLPDVPMLPYEAGLLNALAEIGGRRAGPPRKPYRPLPGEARAALEEAVEPLVEMERDL